MWEKKKSTKARIIIIGKKEDEITISKEDLEYLMTRNLALKSSEAAFVKLQQQFDQLVAICERKQKQYNELSSTYDELLKKFNELRQQSLNLIQHEVKLSDDQTFSCDLCMAVLKSKTALNYHNKSKKHLKHLEELTVSI